MDFSWTPFVAVYNWPFVFHIERDILGGFISSTDNTDAPTVSFERQQVSAALDNWKRKLLDLTKRNRALNFKVNKVSTVTIRDELPAEVFSWLYLQERPMRFLAAPEGGSTRQRVVEDQEGGQESRQNGEIMVKAEPFPARVETSEFPGDPDDDEDDGTLSPDFTPYEKSSLGEGDIDDCLQTTSDPEALDRSLRRLDEGARLAIGEQGVNPLHLALGMLHYTDAPYSQQVYKAPLLLLPVELTRNTARSGYQIRITDDDPVVNPALTELLRLTGIQLPEIADVTAMNDEYDLQNWFIEVQNTTSDKTGWAVKTDIYLGLFSFQKFVMYKDLDANTEPISSHPQIRKLVLRSGTQAVGLPQEIRSMELDREFPPESTFQVVDADGSQVRALAACARDYDLVVEGPPGTGKSQTITNMIAQALAANKSVLFVAEKMAALEVVHGRLLQAGLGEFCLELHSTKANKRLVMKELGAALDASLQKVAGPTASGDRLPAVRSTLAAYVSAVHSDYGTLGISPYTAYGRLGSVIDAPPLKYDGPVDAVTSTQLEQTVRDLEDLRATAADIGLPSQHSWRETRRTFYTADDLQAVKETAEQLVGSIEELVHRASELRDAFGFPEIRGFTEVAVCMEVASVLRRSPGAPVPVLESETWNSPPSQALQLIKRGREVERLKERTRQLFVQNVLDQEHSSDIRYVEEKANGLFGLLAISDSGYRSIRQRWLRYRLPSFRGSMLDQAREMKQVDVLRAERAELAAADPEARNLFGPHWQGERSSWNMLSAYIDWVVEFRRLCGRYHLSDRIFRVACQPQPDMKAVEGLKAAMSEVQDRLAELRSVVGWPGDHLESAPFAEISERAQGLIQNLALGPRWAAFESARQGVDGGISRGLLPAAMNGEVSFPDLVRAFIRAFHMRWLSLVVSDRPPLSRFHTMTHEERVAEFRRLDERVLLENRAALVGLLRDRLQNRLREQAVTTCLPHLRNQINRQRGHAPLRKTMKLSGPAIRAIKPCLMMSPLTVAQLLDGSRPTFDLVIFDEASQLPPEDAVGAIARASRLAVVGDPKQLPPTNFFVVANGQLNASVDDDGAPIYEDSESILEQFMSAGVPMSRLKWHYRSAHESLISFSNSSFYDSELYTFPSVDAHPEAAGLQFEHVADGVYEGKGLNPKEARRVADEVVQFAKDQLVRQERGESVQSLGVGTFNLRQQIAIQDLLEMRRRWDPRIEPFFSRSLSEPFFVKNLENIQGDERDVILISVTYAKSADGKLRYNFGPLNYENGFRRLNVLITRARRRMRIFSSIKGEDIDLCAVTSEGPRLLREFLIYAEHGRIDNTQITASADTESEFERDVYRELTRRGVKVVPQVGVSGYRIDLGVLDDVVPGRFLCGIECDGAAYHSSETARDRDRLRAQVLENRGWTIHRVWSTDWFKDRPGQIHRLIDLVEKARSRAAEQGVAEVESQGPAASEPKASAGEQGQPVKGPELEADPTNEPYKRPVASSYVITTGEGRYATLDFLSTPLGAITEAALMVIETESPVHRIDLLARVAGMWAVKVGSRIEARILEACRSLESSKKIGRSGDFYWRISAVEHCPFRSRAGTRIPGDRIAPDEYRNAIVAVLANGHSFSRSQLVNEVRAIFGFNRTGGILDRAISSVIEAMLAENKLGEGGTGLRLRR